MRRARASRGEGGLTQSVRRGEHRTPDAPGDSSPRDARQQRLHAEGRADYQTDGAGNLGIVDADDRQRQAQIAEGQQRHQHLGHLDQPDGATEDHHRDQAGHDDRRPPGRQPKSPTPAAGDGTDLEAGEHQAIADDTQDRDERSHLGPVQAVPDVIRHTADILLGPFQIFVLDLAFERLGQAGLCVADGAAQQAGDSHPQQGARAATADRGGNTRDGTHTDAAREGHGQGLE